MIAGVTFFGTAGSSATRFRIFVLLIVREVIYQNSCVFSFRDER
jgi:hypothetical protein